MCGDLRTSMPDSLTRAWDGSPREQPFLWEVRKGRHRARCAIWSHPVGWELRATVDGELLKSQAYRDANEVIRDMTEWQRQFEAKGWCK